jgi:hypothetical protein
MAATSLKKEVSVPTRRFVVIWLALGIWSVLFSGAPSEAAEGARRTATEKSAGADIYVSKLGDNSDGRSWGRAFHTIQAALSAIPDDRGGHRILIRPDTYMEANLFPAHRGAPNAYNLLIGDGDSRLGSGATGWVIIDSGDPEKGFKSYDWWSTIRAYRQGWSPEHKAPTFSAAGWDRWVIRNVYATGGDAALFWDLVDKAEPFTVRVEDCVGIGRAFGGGVANHLSRRDEPIVFLRCYLASLDWWGDAGAAYVRSANPHMRDYLDAVFEDCTLVAPDNAFELAAPGFPFYTHVNFKGCRLIVLNFSQPAGTPSTGIIHVPLDAANHLKVDLEDCLLMGFKVFGESPILFTTKGRVEAYVQYQQPVPEGFVRLTSWPAKAFRSVAPPVSPVETKGLAFRRGE